MKQIDKQRFFAMAEAYDRMCQHLVPGYDFLQDEVLRIAAADGKRDLTVVDLGAGRVIDRLSIESGYGKASQAAL